MNIEELIQEAGNLSPRDLRDLADFCRCLANGTDKGICKNCSSENIIIYDGVEKDKWIECGDCGSILQEEKI